MKKVYIVAIFLVTTIGMSACSSKQSNQTVKESFKNSQSSKALYQFRALRVLPSHQVLLKSLLHQ